MVDGGDDLRHPSPNQRHYEDVLGEMNLTVAEFDQKVAGVTGDEHFYGGGTTAPNGSTFQSTGERGKGMGRSACIPLSRERAR